MRTTIFFLLLSISAAAQRPPVGVIASALRVSTPAAATDSVLVDLGNSSNLSSGNWNNSSNTASPAIANLESFVTGSNTGIGFDAPSWEGILGNGANGTTSSTLYPSSATVDGYYQTSGTSKTVSFSGLDASKTYKVYLYASRAEVGDSRITQYVVGSFGTVQLQTANNVDGQVAVGGITGVTSLTITASAVTGGFFYLNVIRLSW